MLKNYKKLQNTEKLQKLKYNKCIYLHCNKQIFNYHFLNNIPFYFASSLFLYSFINL